MELCEEVAATVRVALDALDDWGLAQTIPGQYRHDLTADQAALAVLERAGVGVVSEESGLARVRLDRAGLIEGDAVVVVLDPVDGSTNASRGVPWYATSLCCVDRDGLAVALVRNQATGVTYRATRGAGATRDGRAVRPSPVGALGESYVAVSGMTPRPLGWGQFRCMGACALDLCAVAEGVFDAYVDCSHDAHGVWDYLGGVLIAREAGAVVGDAHDRELLVLDHRARRTPVAAGTTELFESLVAQRSGTAEL